MLVQLRVSLFLLISVFRVKGSIYLFNTNDDLKIEFYDCIRDVRSSLDYCRRPREPIDLVRENDTRSSCRDNGGELYRFSELRSKNISIPTILHQWKSTLERVEDYQRYTRDSSSQFDGWICQCHHLGAFGKNCEYQLPVGQTLEEILQWQLLKRKENTEKVQIYGDVICHETMKCNSGVLCLDWREICDGIQHCLEGRDEENCDLLEMNQCDQDEYRCVNGMCIAEEFFLDGDLECLDWSDEMVLKTSEECPLESVNAECDDHLCPTNEWSCGDGQCIRDRLRFQRYKSSTCVSERDQYFICETHLTKRRWTMANGRCFDVDEDGGRRYEESSRVNRSRDEECSYLLQCSLTKGGEKGCPCGRERKCVDQMKEVCPFPLIVHPSRSIVAPFFFFLFNYTNDWRNKLPSFVLIGGTVRCEYSLITLFDTIILYDPRSEIRQVLNDLFCQPSRNVSWSSEDYQSRRRDRCHRGNESIDRCSGWNPCLSSTRIGDLSQDCLNPRDEGIQTELTIEKSCARVRRHRFHCSAEQPKCFSVMRLGGSTLGCRNRYHERWFGSGRRLSSMNCDQEKKDECSLLRQYIEHSWTSTLINNNSQMSPKRRIPFRSYCQTFWDLETREDENIDECYQWWVCPKDQQRCGTGQCIEESWIYDREWDCADASDEYRWLDSITERALQGASEDNFTNRSYFIPRSCPQSDPFLCLSANATRQGFECFDLSQIADGHIDCAGGIDEQNTLQRCSQSSLSMLGPNFLCPSSNTCIPLNLLCINGHRCPHRSDDKYWCDREYQLLDTERFSNWTCFDGQSLYLDTDRCNMHFECPFAEDEYMCDYPGTAIWDFMPSRERKRAVLQIKQEIVALSRYPTDVTIVQLDFHSLSTLPPTTNLSSSSSSSSLSPYSCNRGLGVVSTNNHSTIRCFCPPQYYGEKCQFHADRLSVVLHLDLSSQSIYSSSASDSLSLLKLLVSFLVHDEVRMRNQFHFHWHSALEFGLRRSKLHTSFPFPHSSSSREQRRRRFFNRSSLLSSHPYSIRIELYRARRDQQPSLIALWKYSLPYAHLPVSRLAKVLRLDESSTERNPCSSRPCLHPHQQCQPLMNNKSQFICLCKTNFRGENCSRRDLQCDQGYCSRSSLCQPNSRLSLGEDSLSLPFCLCPFNRYGQRCEIEHDGCLSSPCLHGGSCFPDVQPDRVICLCTKEYSGARCQFRRPSIHLSLSIDNVPHRGAVIQYLRIDPISLHLRLLDQQVFRSLPANLEYFHSDLQTTLPDLVLAKVYSSHEGEDEDLYLLSVHLDLRLFSVNGSTQISPITQCQHIRTFFNGNFQASLFPLLLLSLRGFLSFSSQFKNLLPFDIISSASSISLDTASAMINIFVSVEKITLMSNVSTTMNNSIVARIVSPKLVV